MACALRNWTDLWLQAGGLNLCNSICIHSSHFKLAGQLTVVQMLQLLRLMPGRVVTGDDQP
jgi:hypothetical protein